MSGTIFSGCEFGYVIIDNKMLPCDSILILHESKTLSMKSRCLDHCSDYHD